MTVALHWTDIDWQPFVKDRLIDGARVRYLDYGSGPTLVLLHGMAASWQWWLENVPALARRHRVIAIDLPGSGHSEPLPPPAEMSAHAETVLGLLTELGVDAATVAGHSMGGLVAIEMALAAPGRIHRLVLVDAGGVPMTEQRLKLTLLALRACAAIVQRRFARRALAASPSVRKVALRAGFRDPGVISPELAAEIMPIFAGPGFVDSVAASGRSVRAIKPESISCPVLLVWGERDIPAPLRYAQDMRDRLADCELVVIGGAGHSPMIESPNEFNRIVLDFMASER